MHKTIIILIILSIRIGYAQQNFADSMLFFEKQIFVSQSAYEKNELLVKKFNTLLKASITGKRTYSELFRIEPELITDTVQKKEFLWNAALLCFLNNDPNNASIFLNKHIENQGMSKENQILSMMINNNFDTARVTASIGVLVRYDSSYTCMNCLNDLTRYSKKNKLLYSISSAVIPGSGSMLLGYIVKGLISTSMVAGSAYFLYNLVQEQLFINSFVWGSGLTFKFYIGNIKLTEKLFDEKENKIKNKKATACQQKLSVLLQKDPIQFK